MIFPFVAIEGQEKIKKAIILNIINKKIGGLLICGEKGTAKSTMIRGIPKICKNIEIINLPLNITEDNLIGSIDIEKTIKSGKKVFQEGLLKKCHNNILYIDEINLLGENIISTILEIMSRENNYIEREGMSISHKCKFILMASMNPEEGDLRPQLLDKFGLYVKAEGSKDVIERVKIVKKRMEFEDNPKKFTEKYVDIEKLLEEKIYFAKENLKKIKVSEQIMNIAIKIVEEANCLGNRAEIIMIETAKAIAALDKRTYLNIDDLKEAATFVLPHRSYPKREELQNNYQEQKKDEEKNRENLKNNSQQNNNLNENNNKEKNTKNLENNLENNESIQEKEEKQENIFNNSQEREKNFDIGEIFKVKDIFLDNLREKRKYAGVGKRYRTKNSFLQGKYVKSTFPKGKIRDFAFDATLRAAAPFQKEKNKNFLTINIKKENIRVKIRERRTGANILFVVDSSGSMGVKKRMEAVKGAVFSLLKNAYEKRDRVGMVSFRKDRAEELLAMTRSVELAQKKLKTLTTGGKTPLAEGILKAYKIIKKELKKDRDIIPLIIFLSDGRANYSNNNKDAIKESLEIAQKLKQDKIKCIVIDTEEGFIKLELARTLAEKMGATYYRLDDIKSDNLLELIKNNI